MTTDTLPRATTPVHTRWLIRGDRPAVMAIERASFPAPWTCDELVACLRFRNVIAHVAEDRADRVVGYMVYALYCDRVELVNFAVAPWARRAGVGAQMIAKLVGKLSGYRRSRVGLHVRDGNLPAQLFFRAAGFRATAVVPGHYPDTAEDAYRMEYCLPGIRVASDPHAGGP